MKVMAFLAAFTILFVTWGSSLAAAPEIAIASQSNTTIGADGTVTVKRVIKVTSGANLLRGSSQVTPQAVAGFFSRATYATNATCKARDDGSSIGLDCAYDYRVPIVPVSSGDTVTLPGDSLAAYFAPLTITYPYAVSILEENAIEAPGTLLALPRMVSQRVPVASRIEQDRRLESATRLMVRTRTTIAPGDGLQPHFAEQTPTIITFAPNYFPAPLNWVLFFAAASGIVYHIGLITPLRRVRRVPRTRLVPFLNFVIGAILSVGGTGALLLGLTWMWASTLIAALLAEIQNLVALVPFGFVADILNAGPYITLALGLIFSALGAGVLRWQDWARRGTVVLGYILFFVTVGAAPFLLLLPGLFPYQEVVLFALTLVLLSLSTFPIRLLTTPEMRLRYAE